MSHFFVGSFLNQDLLNIMLLVQEKRFWLGHVGPTPSRQLNKSMLGDCGRQGLLDFWEHLRGMEEWSEHPVVNDPNVDKGSLYLSSPILFSYRVCAKASIKAGSSSYPSNFGFGNWDTQDLSLHLSMWMEWSSSQMQSMWYGL